ncbi:MAG TPA: hypothetical protein VG474_14690 [Solirubrobacteraceae bacterium]|nr:hypothetical protein [Solirubrobacteraceae bacterium]
MSAALKGAPDVHAHDRKLAFVAGTSRMTERDLHEAVAESRVEQAVVARREVPQPRPAAPRTIRWVR